MPDLPPWCPGTFSEVILFSMWIQNCSLFVLFFFWKSFFESTFIQRLLDDVLRSIPFQTEFTNQSTFKNNLEGTVLICLISLFLFIYQRPLSTFLIYENSFYTTVMLKMLCSVLSRGSNQIVWSWKMIIKLFLSKPDVRLKGTIG